MTKIASDERPVVSILTLGCKLNQSDSERIARRLAGEGVRVVDRMVPGVWGVIVNSCSVTHVADRKARRLVRQARKLSPDAQIVLTGCYAETAPADIAAMTGADFVLRNLEKPQIADRLLEKLAKDGDPAAGCPTPRANPLRTRAFVKIQEGCNELCAFCIVPYTRGREESVPIEDVVQQVEARETEGVLEVVLTGTQLGNYGRDLGWTREEQGPRWLLAELLARTSVPRIRLSSLQAQDISPELLDLWRDERLCPHFHLPLQSGSDAVLGPMRRRYTSAEYRDAVSLIRERVPNVAVTTDVIAGFPGETAADFEATLSLCQEMGFAAMHCFPYSRRPHTGAEQMRGHLPPSIRRERLERLLAVAERSSIAFRQSLLGQTAMVLWEAPDSRLPSSNFLLPGAERQEVASGLTGNYVRVYTRAIAARQNSLRRTRLTGLHADGMLGELSEDANGKH
ncbi:MAG: tRNA (N(6)-L-threonylcarbamoyladenosine(37)-C(2))-methylthiotransferase MtaB [Chloroflexota bacterium]